MPKDEKERQRVWTDPIKPVSPHQERLVYLETIDKGGMGIVTKVFDTNLLSARAKKATLPGSDAAYFCYLVEEAQTTAQLDHQNIPPVHELGIEDDGSPYFAMKYVTGKNLARIIDELGDRPRTQEDIYFLLGVFLRVCDAIAFAHEHGVLHLDLKPKNIMCGEFGEVYVLDWGIAKLAHTERAPLLVEDHVPAERPRYPRNRVPDVGTLGYAPPEQVHGNYGALDPRSDVFSLGAILYEMFAGQDPFPEPDDLEKTRRSLQGDVEPLENVIWYHLPPRLPRIAMRALSSDPVDRHQSVSELREDVEHFLVSGWNFERRTYPAGSYIVRKGEPGTEAFVIVEGRCEVLQTVDGAEYHERWMRDGDVFGETAVFTDEIRTATVRADEEVTVAVVKGGDFEEKLGMGFWLGLFVEALAKRFKEKDALANNLERDLLETDVANAALKHLLASGSVTPDGGREAPLSPLLDLLTARFDKSREEILAVLERTEDVSILEGRIAFTRP